MLNINDIQYKNTGYQVHYAECPVWFIVMMNVVMLYMVMLYVVMLGVVGAWCKS
jgi:hypothetical protein